MPFSPKFSEQPTFTEVRSALEQAGSELHQLYNKPAGERSDSDKTELRSIIDFINTYDVVEKTLGRTERAAEPESRGPVAAFDTVTSQVRSPGQQVLESEKYKRALESHSLDNGTTTIEIEGSLFANQRALVSEGTFTGGVGNGNLAVLIPQAAPVTEPPRVRRLFVRSLISSIQTSFPSLPYIQELNPSVNELGASAVAEATAKPEVTLQAERVDAPIKKIAAWIPVTTEILEDAPALQGYIEQRLTYMLLLREEQQLLSGSGTGEQIKGIRNWSGVQTQTALGTNDFPATLAMAIGKIENVDGDADGVAMNPLDYWQQLGSRHATLFDNGGGGNAPAQVSGITWGLPSIRTRSIERGKFIAGAWYLGATLLDRQEVRIRLGEQHASYFIENKVAILAEERVGLQVHRPDWFVIGDVTFS